MDVKNREQTQFAAGILDIDTNFKSISCLTRLLFPRLNFLSMISNAN